MAAAPFSTNDDLRRREFAEQLSAANSAAPAHDIVRVACKQQFPDEVAVVSSFGAEAAALLHIIAEVAPATPVIFLDTGKHFDETVRYVRDLALHLGLYVVATAFPSKHQIAADDPAGDLHLSKPDLCCHIRKTLPMSHALRPYKAFITGRKRHQTAARATMAPFEAFDRWIRVNPLWNWTGDDVESYFSRHKLPSHPLRDKGYASIGCAPCTRAVLSGEDVRAGRWAGSEKTECGIHVSADGRIERKNGRHGTSGT